MGDGLCDLVQKDMSYCGPRPSYCERTRQERRPNAAPSGNQCFKVLIDLCRPTAVIVGLKKDIPLAFGAMHAFTTFLDARPETRYQKGQ